MGQGFSGESQERKLVISSELTEEYKSASLESIDECYTTMTEIFGRGELTKFTLTQDEFDMVFSLAFADPVEHFQTIWAAASSEEDDVDDDVEEEDESPETEDEPAVSVANVFHVFCALYLLCQEELYGVDDKLRAIYKLFDFDSSGGLNRVELECLFQACAVGVATATGTPVPVTDSVLTNMAESVVKEQQQETSLAQLKEWLSSRKDVRRYLSEYVFSAKMVSDYQKKVELFFEATTQNFLKVASETPSEAPEITVDDFAEKILKALPGSPPTEDELRSFVDLVDASDKADGKIGFDEFADAILPWLAFSIIDDDQSGSLSLDELKLLIWISGGEQSDEPTRAVVERARREMDVDKDGELRRLEWIHYNAGFDPVTGVMKFSKAARDLFKSLDTDKSKSVDCAEVNAMFRSQLETMLKNLEAQDGATFSPRSVDELNTLVDAAADEVGSLLDSNGDGSIEWQEFSRHVDEISRKQEKIRNYARVLLAQDRRGHSKKPKCLTISKVRRRSTALLGALSFVRRGSLSLANLHQQGTSSPGSPINSSSSSSAITSSLLPPPADPEPSPVAPVAAAVGTSSSSGGQSSSATAATAAPKKKKKKHSTPSSRKS